MVDEGGQIGVGDVDDAVAVDVTEGSEDGQRRGEVVGAVVTEVEVLRAVDLIAPG